MRSTNQSIFGLLNKTGDADEPGHVPSIKTNGRRKELATFGDYGGQVCLDRSCDMWPNIVMLEDNIVVSLFVL